MKEDNKGYQMIKKLGWKPELGLGPDNDGIRSPLGPSYKRDRRGLGEKGIRGEPTGKENRTMEKKDTQRKDEVLSVRDLDQPIEVRSEIHRSPNTDLNILVEMLEHEERMKIKEAEKTKVGETVVEDRDKERCEGTLRQKEVLMQVEDVGKRKERGSLAKGSRMNNTIEGSAFEQRPHRVSPEGGATTGKYIHKRAQYYMGGTFGESEEPSAARACKKYSEDTFVYKDTLSSPNWP